MFFSKFIKKLGNKSLIEPILLFMVFFLPGFLMQNREIDSEIFNSVFFNVYYLVSVVPQIFLLLYLISLKGPGSFNKYGISEFSLKDIPVSVMYAAGALVLSVLVTALFSLAALLIPAISAESVMPAVDWTISNPAILPLVFITTLAIGYSEELFFRSYLLTEFINEGDSGVLVPVIAVSVLFASGHLYQGPGGFAASLTIGIFFSFLFLKNRKVHTISIGHALYNFSTLVISIFMS